MGPNPSPDRQTRAGHHHAPRSRAAWFAAALLVLLGLPAGATLPGWERLEVASTDRYLWLYLPASSTDDIPLVVFFHGSGSRPEDWRPLLEPWADELGFALLLPRSVSTLSFGIGGDDQTVRDGLQLAEERLADHHPALRIDRRRIALAGHSAGGAYALTLAYAGQLPVAGVFALGSPFRLVITPLGFGGGDLPPVRLYYGSEDPNFANGSYSGWSAMLDRLGIAVTPDVGVGAGHSGWNDEVFRTGFAFLLAQRWSGTDPEEPPAGPCQPDETTLCLGAGRFALAGSWSTPQGSSGPARVVTAPGGAAASSESGLFWFFAPERWEVTAKVIDGCLVNGHHWVFFSSLSNVEQELVVRDLVQGGERTYRSPQGKAPTPTFDTRAFPCP
jgi:predicted esterase